MKKRMTSVASRERQHRRN